MDWLAIPCYSRIHQLAHQQNRQTFRFYFFHAEIHADFQKITGEIGGIAQLGHTDIFTDEMLASGSLKRSIPYPSQPL